MLSPKVMTRNATHTLIACIAPITIIPQQSTVLLTHKTCVEYSSAQCIIRYFKIGLTELSGPDHNTN